MIYSAQCSGQLCNRIVWFVQALATAIDCKVNLVNFFGRDLRRFSDLYPEAIPEIKIRNLNFGYCLPLDVIHGWMLRFRRFKKGYYDSNAERCRRWRENGLRGPLLLWDWYFRNDEAIVRHREEICAYLRVRDEFTVRPNEIAARSREDGTIVVGVHLRRGDYKEACSHLYFDDATYLRFMKEFIASCRKDNVVFVMVSNEPINTGYFAQNGLHVVDATGRPQEDIITLSLCDYIMGPGSTFSWWAAYYGDKPRLSLDSRDDTVSLDKFAKVTALLSRFD